MLLILDQSKSDFSIQMQKVAETMGLDSLFLTAIELVHDVKLQYRLSNNHTEGKLKYNGVLYKLQDIIGVYCAINSFYPGLWKHFSIADAQYAAMEYHALWWSILHGLNCPVVNPPAGDTLAGIQPSLTQLVYMAQRFGLKTPKIYYSTSGKTSSVHPQKGTYTIMDLSVPYEAESYQSSTGVPKIIRNDVRKCEIIEGDPVWIAFVGNRLFAATMEDKEMTTQFSQDKIPVEIVERLHSMHTYLGLKLAEYHFVVTRQQQWVIYAMTRQPNNVLRVFGESMMSHLLAQIVGKAV